MHPFLHMERINALQNPQQTPSTPFQSAVNIFVHSLIVQYSKKHLFKNICTITFLAHSDTPTVTGCVTAKQHRSYTAEMLVREVKIGIISVRRWHQYCYAGASPPVQYRRPTIHPCSSSVDLYSSIHHETTV